MRICILGSRGYPSTYGGFETFVRRFASSAASSGHDVTVFGRRGAVPEPLPDDPVRVHNVRGLGTKSASTLTHGLASALAAKGQGFDAALVLNVANGFYLPLLERSGIPTAVNVDGLEWERAKWGRLARRVFLEGARATARWATEIIVDSRVIGETWDARFGRAGTFIPYGADVVSEHRSDLLVPLGLEPDGYALVVARFTPENNVGLALDVFETLDGRQPLVVVGSANYDDPITARVTRMRRTWPRFSWLGHVADQELLAQLWGNARLYIHGHSVGGTNPALLQAMGHGAPVLAFDTPFNREVLGPAGVLFRSAAELRRAWERLSDDPGERRALGVAGQRRVSDAYRWDDVVRDYLDVLRGAVRG